MFHLIRPENPPEMNCYMITLNTFCELFSDVPALHQRAQEIVLASNDAVKSDDVWGGVTILQKGIDELRASEHYPKRW